MTKNLNEYTIEEFREMELFGEDCLFNNVVIVPMNELHDSGYRCMKFILAYHGEIVGAVGGWSDVVRPNGFGNRGLVPDYSKTPNISLSIDCLGKSGCVRLMMHGEYECDDFIGSDFLFYKTSGDMGETE